MTTHTLTKAHDADGGRRRYYVDGARVPFGRYLLLDQRAVRQDSFITIRRGARWLHSKCATFSGRV